MCRRSWAVTRGNVGSIFWHRDTAPANHESCAVDTDDGPTEVGALRWLGETSRDARELLGERDGDAEERDEITAVVRDYLIECGGSAPAADVLNVARAAGLNENVVKKSRKKSGIRTERRGFAKGASWVWTIGAPIGAIDS